MLPAGMPVVVNSVTGGLIPVGRVPGWFIRDG
jgi:hypothetical protein